MLPSPDPDRWSLRAGAERQDTRRGGDGGAWERTAVGGGVRGGDGEDQEGPRRPPRGDGSARELQQRQLHGSSSSLILVNISQIL